LEPIGVEWDEIDDEVDKWLEEIFGKCY